ncbi:MAG TPA: RNA 3'-terminal phosphate cyclase [Vicinamibacteria bacterium]|nr:RNA 3'-terminal phosphate cyclase [Vicinamibacteria bacterium]
MKPIDGSQHSGSGTIVRFAVAMSALSESPVRIENIRAKRPTPGLRPQHVSAVRATAQLCNAKTGGLYVGSRELTFAPSGAIRGGEFSWDIGTAGSTTMLALSILPLSCFAAGPIRARIIGGVFQDFAPSPHHMQNVLLPLLSRMGADAQVKLLRAGYVPKGTGQIELLVKPVSSRLYSLHALEPGGVTEVEGVAFSSHLSEQRVSERMANSCEKILNEAGISAKIARVDDELAPQPGASLAIWAQSSTGCLFGGDRAGARRRRSETIGHTVARRFLEDLRSGATVDRYLADQLVFFGALAEGTTDYISPAVTDHLVTNLWLAEQFGARIEREGLRVRIEGLGLPI